MIKELISIARKLTGTVLVIGVIDEKLLNILENNKNLTIFSQLSNETKKEKKKKKKFLGHKTINIRKVYKELKKQHYDYVICDFEIVKPHFNEFIKNSYKMTDKEIYFIVNEEKYDPEEITKRYTRYKATCILKGKDGQYLIKIDVSKMKMNIFKRYIYNFRDFGYNIVEFISSIIIS